MGIAPSRFFPKSYETLESDPGRMNVAWNDSAPMRLLSEVTSTSGIPLKLRELVGCDHCVIWKPSKRLKPDTPLIEPYEQWRLYPWTSTFDSRDENEQAQHSGLPLEFQHDFTGRTYKRYWDDKFRDLSPESRTSANFRDEDAESLSAQFMRDRDLARIAVSFFRERVEDAPYAVSFYRKTDRPPFTQEEVAVADACATCIPILIERFSGRNLRTLVQHVQSLLLTDDSQTTTSHQNNTLDSLCRQLSTDLHCVEVTIVLKDNECEVQPFRVMATSLDASLVQQRFAASKENGLTGYVLSTGGTLEFHDLRNFDNATMKRLISETYQGIRWGDSATIKEHSKKKYPHIHDDKLLPPIAFLGVPVVDPRDGQMRGVIRCSLGTGPYFFIRAEREVLELIAQSLGRWWSDGLRFHDERENSKLLQGLLTATGSLQQSIKTEVSVENGDGQNGLTRAAIKQVRDAIDGVQQVMFRRYDAENCCLVIESIVRPDGEMPPANEGDRIAIEQCRLVEEMLDLPSTPHLWLSRSRIDSEGSEVERKLFAGLAGTYAVRVSAQSQTVGVIDFGWSRDFQQSAQSGQITEVMHSLADQLSLFALVQSSRRLLTEALDNQIAMTRSVGHQIKSPLSNARDTLDLLYAPFASARQSRDAAFEIHERMESLTRRHLPRLYGMVRKAQSVGRFMEYYGMLKRGEPLNLARTHIDLRTLARKAREIYDNNLEHTSDRMTQPVLTGALAGLLSGESSLNAFLAEGRGISCNPQAFEQILDALISNALKYGQAPLNLAGRSAVEIEGVDLPGEFRIDVVNLARKGNELTDKEAEMCFEHGYRAEKFRGKIGSGLGLWIAKRLAEDQKGRIEAIATDKLSKTRFRLYFKAVSRVGFP